MKWNKIEDGDPGLDGSDEYYMVVLCNRFITTAYFFIDSFGSFWSSQWDVWDKMYSDEHVTHWAELPKLPNIKAVE